MEEASQSGDVDKLCDAPCAGQDNLKFIGEVGGQVKDRSSSRDVCKIHCWVTVWEHSGCSLNLMGDCGWLVDELVCTCGRP